MFVISSHLITLIVVRSSRRIQNYFAAGWRAVAWQDCEAVDGPSYRLDAGRPESQEGNLRVGVFRFVNGWRRH